MTTTTPSLAARVRAALRHCYADDEQAGNECLFCDPDGFHAVICRRPGDRISVTALYWYGSAAAKAVTASGGSVPAALRGRTAELLGVEIEDLALRATFSLVAHFTADVPAWCGGER